MSKRNLLFVSIMLCLLLLTVGCSQTELNYLALQQEVNSLKVLESNGSFSFSLKIGPDFSLEQTFKIFSKTDLNKEIATLELYLAGSEEPLTEMIMEKDTLYFYLPGIIEFLSTLGYDEIAAEFATLFKGAEYLSTQKSFFNQKQTHIIQKLLTALPEGYPDFSTNLITEKDQTFTLEMNGQQVFNLVFDFLEHNLLNNEAIVNWLGQVLDSLSDEELTLLNLDPAERSVYETMLTIASQELETEQATYLKDLNILKKDLLVEIQPYLDGFTFSNTLSQDSLGAYNSQVNLRLEQPGIDFQLSGQNRTREIAPFTITIPDKVIAFSELTPKMVIDVEQANYTLNGEQGSLIIHNIEGHLYLPLRKIGELLGEEVGWDSELGYAYVVRNGLPLEMTGIIIDDRIYIKIRDFEKLSYQVKWDEATRSATIIPSLF
ncbi:MAG TPA: copper amine oxidase N-terminal domain-containing protein [Clostridia bacterium]|nr:copper amine oxidase N-terminal domain-containing protein [Clostridia bacterium]